MSRTGGPTATTSIGLAEVREVGRLLAAHLTPTPALRAWDGLVLKAESLHACGSFKIRGALTTMLRLQHEGRLDRGVICHSSGNHAIAVADAGRRLGVPVVVVMPHDAPAAKLDRTRALGAEVHLVGSGSDERVATAGRIAAARDLPMVEPYDSEHVIAATGTIALELLEQAPQVDEIHVAVSGGGLAAGVAMAAALLAEELGRPMRVVGVEPELAADAAASRRAGRIVTLPADQMARTMADGLRVQQVGSLTWPYIDRYVDDLVTVSEEQIGAAVRRAATETRLVVEPSGAVPIASATAGLGSTAAPERRAAIVGGGNLDAPLLASLLADTSLRA